MDQNTGCCQACGKRLEADEIAIYRKLVNRGAKSYLCIPCLASYFRCDKQLIYDRIVSLREMGCTLFVRNEE